MVEMLTKDEVAELCKVDPRTVQRMVAAHQDFPRPRYLMPGAKRWGVTPRQPRSSSICSPSFAHRLQLVAVVAMPVVDRRLVAGYVVGVERVHRRPRRQRIAA